VSVSVYVCERQRQADTLYQHILYLYLLNFTYIFSSDIYLVVYDKASITIIIVHTVCAADITDT